MSVYSPSEGHWYYEGPAAGVAVQLGEATNNPAPGDFDGDGKTDISVCTPSSGFWYRINSSDGTVSLVNFGLKANIPQATDYLGDGF